MAPGPRLGCRHSVLERTLPDKGAAVAPRQRRVRPRSQTFTGPCSIGTGPGSSKGQQRATNVGNRLLWACAARSVRGVGVAFLASVALLLGGGGEADASRWGRGYLPNAEVVTQDGKTLRFYDDLIEGKVFVINFIFTTCRDFCPLAAARLAELQDKLGDAMGRDIFFYSISVDPETDTPERLKAYADTFQAGPGWLFITGKPEDIHAIRHKLGDRAKSLSEHRNEILLGNGATGEWARNNVLGDLDSLAITVRSMDAKWLPPAGTRRSTQAVKVDFAARPGQALYKRLCAGCHTVGRGDRVGPDLAGISGRRERDWLLKFISEPEKMRVAKDPVALDLVAKYPTVRMPPMGVSRNDAADLLAYVAHLEGQGANRLLPLESLFGLTTHTGARLTPDALQGEPAAVFFGFTHCPDVCPTTLLDWSNVLAGLGKDGDRMKVLFVSVDGERDTPAALAAYMGSFDPRILALTGSAAQIARAARAFDALYEKVAGGTGYTYDHTTKVYLIGREGRLAATADLRTPEPERQKLLAGLLARR
jgi:protein SCO1